MTDEHDDVSGVRTVGGAQSIRALLEDPTQQHVVHLLAGELIGPAHGRSWAEVCDELAALLERDEATRKTA